MEPSPEPEPPSDALTHLDPSSARGQIYQQLVQLSGVTTTALAEAVGTSGDVVRRHLDVLERHGLVMRMSTTVSTTWEALQPATAMRDDLAAREAALIAARERVQALSDLYRDARQAETDGPAVEVVNDPVQINGQFLRLQEDAVSEIRALDRPPYIGSFHPVLGRQQVDTQTQRMAAGVHYRVVYQRAVFENAPLAALSRAYIAIGEDARELRELPMKLTIMDHARALISLEPYGSSTDPSALLVHPSALLDALGEIFETYWRVASPVDAAPGDLTLRQSDVLRLLADGATDDAIARTLHLSTRTVTRTIAELHERLGATTRFQAGLHAAARGYLPGIEAS